MKYDKRQPNLLPGEPWFLIRGRDVFAVDAIRAYADLAAKRSSSHHEPATLESTALMQHALQILKVAEHIDNWQQDNPDKVREPKPEPRKQATKEKAE
jgi:hypothetical protein